MTPSLVDQLLSGGSVLAVVAIVLFLGTEIDGWFLRRRAARWRSGLRLVRLFFGPMDETPTPPIPVTYWGGPRDGLLVEPRFVGAAGLWEAAGVYRADLARHRYVWRQMRVFDLGSINVHIDFDDPDPPEPWERR